MKKKREEEGEYESATAAIQPPTTRYAPSFQFFFSMQQVILVSQFLRRWPLSVLVFFFERKKIERERERIWPKSQISSISAEKE